MLGLWSWQAVAHGADAVLYFQMRASRGACEKYHGAVLDHAGPTDTRAFREIAELGAQLAGLGDAVIGARTPARTAVLLDWDSWWACEMTDGLNRHVRYLDVVLRYYGALWRAGAAVDVVPRTADLSGYDVVLAPVLHVIQDDIADRLRAVAEAGATVVTTFWSGRVDASTRAFLADIPGPLAPLVGVRVEETDSTTPDRPNAVTMTVGGRTTTTPAHLVQELLVPEGAEVVGTYAEDFYAGRAAITRHGVGRGAAWYVGTDLDGAGVDALVRAVLDEHGLVGPHADEPDVECVERVGARGRIRFLLDHAACAVTVERVHDDGTTQTLLRTEKGFRR